jgi:hypothetical protein
MRRTTFVALVLLTGLLGCQLPAERAPLQPLPESSPPLPYAELLTRARLQATAATEAFCINRWVDLEDTAGSLEQTARFLAKATEVPTANKERLAQASEELAKEAGQLRQAAKAQDPEKVTPILQRINLKVRDLRIQN